jgi:hypothetical protein
MDRIVAAFLQHPKFYSNHSTLLLFSKLVPHFSLVRFARVLHFARVLLEPKICTSDSSSQFSGKASMFPDECASSGCRSEVERPKET